ncbi:hypothetical protein ES703_123206 [subsurface metagenome]
MAEGDFFSTAAQHQKGITAHKGVTPQLTRVHPTVQEKAEGTVFEQLKALWGGEWNIYLFQQGITFHSSIPIFKTKKTVLRIVRN